LKLVCRPSARLRFANYTICLLVEFQVQHPAFSFFTLLFSTTVTTSSVVRSFNIGNQKIRSEHSFVQKSRPLSHNPYFRETFITIIHQASFIPCVPSSFSLLFFLSLFQQATLAADHLASPSRLQMARSIAPNWSASARSKRTRSAVLLSKYFHPPMPQNALLGFD
jgi:hypothetical protein